MQYLVVLAIVVCLPVVLVQRTTGLSTESAVVATVILVALAIACQRAFAKARRAQRRAALVSKYRSETEADMILDRRIWSGMSTEQLVDCLGRPEGVDQQLTTRKQKEVWVYGRIGLNRYRNRITVEHGRVVGWTAKG